MKHRIGVLLCGCGPADGSDPQEVIALQLALERAGQQPIFLALNRPQLHVVDHLNLTEAPGETRGQFQESARLVRGKLHLLSEIAPGMLQAVIIPGGQGIAKNFMTTFAFAPDSEPVLPEVKEFLLGVHERGGILAFVSLAEFLGSSLLGPWPEEKGCLDLAAGECLRDPEKGRVLSPGNLSAPSLAALAEEMEKLVAAVLDLHAAQRTT